MSNAHTELGLYQSQVNFITFIVDQCGPSFLSVSEFNTKAQLVDALNNNKAQWSKLVEETKAKEIEGEQVIYTHKKFFLNVYIYNIYAFRLSLVHHHCIALERQLEWTSTHFPAQVLTDCKVAAIGGFHFLADAKRCPAFLIYRIRARAVLKENLHNGKMPHS